MNFKAKHLRKWEIETHSDEWFQFRTTGTEDYQGGIGSSEAGKILGLSPYRPTVMEMYHQKVGTLPIERVDNRYMFFGRQMEPYIKDIWQLHDGTDEGYIDNWKAWEASKRSDDLLVRRAGEVGCYLVNPDYPYLFASCDYRILKGEPRIDTGIVLDFDVPLEIKTISYWAAKKWEEKIPPSYLAQVNLQMLVTDSYYAEIAALQDGTDFFVLPVERNDDICRHLIDESTKFFEERVLPGRELKIQYEEALDNNDKSRAEQIMADICSLEPEPDGSDAVKEFYSENHDKEIEKISGSLDDYNSALRVKCLNTYIKILEGLKQEEKNKLTKIFYDNHAERMEFDGLGYARYFRRGNNKNYELGIQIKSKMNEDEMKGELKKLNLEIEL